jgi:general secretion pathway protein A
MYCNHFGFQEKPFEITPDPEYLFLSPRHREMLASLVHGIRERRGFIVIFGEVGTGKTTLLNAAIDQAGPNTKVAYICNTSLDFEQMLHQILLELGATESEKPLSRIHSIRLLNGLAIEQLSQGGNVVIIVDEAQNTSAAAMENLRLLSNLETRKHKLIQIVLSGQPELVDKLSRPELRQLAQRISIRRSVGPLTEEETYKYLQYRLKVVGYEGAQLFDHKARQLIYAYTGGVPRKINILCDNSLLIGYALKSKRILASYVEESARDLDWSVPYCDPSIAFPEIPQLKPPSSVRPKRQSFKARDAAMISLGLVIAAGSWLLLARNGSLLKAIEPVAPAVHSTRISTPPQNPIRPPEAAESSIVPDQASDSKKSDFDMGDPPTTSVEEATKQSIGPSQASDPRLAEFGKNMPSAHTFENELTSSGAAVEKTDAPIPFIEPPPAPRPDPKVVTNNTSIHTPSNQPKTKKPIANWKDSTRFPISNHKPSDTTFIEVIVGPGDTLYDIVRRAFGTWNKDLEAKVLDKNPQVPIGHTIYPGQAIRLPVK